MGELCVDSRLCFGVLDKLWVCMVRLLGDL